MSVDPMLRNDAEQWTYSSGPSTVPCGTPNSTADVTDCSPPYTTRWVRPLRNDRIQSSAVPPIPTATCRRWSRIRWSTQSNAADMSSRLSSVTFRSSAAISISDQTRSRAVSVEWPFLYADWKRGNKLLADKYSLSWLATTLSTNFDMKDKFDTGR